MEWFVNAVAAVDTDLSPEELLDLCKDVERRLNELHGPSSVAPKKRHDGRLSRIIDIDILFFGDHVFSSPELSLPHPRLAQRAYALVPMLEIAPDFLHPSLNRTVTQMHEALPNPELVYLYGTRGISA
jgi:2-amino-4-hydroxy-6-hydroxymethyldihydropteridine diphosphokinase